MGRWVAKLPTCYGSSLGSNSDISQIYKMGDITKGMANTLAHQNNIQQRVWIPGKAIRVSVRIAAIVLDDDDLSELVAETCIDYETLGQS
jgi:hypothetical protein